MKRSLISLACAALFCGNTAAVTLAKTDTTTVTMGGYLKADLMLSNYSEGAPNSGVLSRQFYVPGTIYGEPDNAKSAVDMQVRETRFNFGTDSKFSDHQVKTFLEFDFMASSGGNERVSNSYIPRLRHAFVKVDNLLVGQTWTTFMNTAALPEALDFIGAADGTPFIRQTQVRYSAGNLDIALENPETTITQEDGKRLVSGTGSMMPDITAKYKFGSDKLKFTIAGLARQLSARIDSNDATNLGYGLSGTMVAKLGDDTLKASVSYGDGAGRYLALNFVNAAVVNSNSAFDNIKSYTGYVSYQHKWNSKWRSNVTVSAFDSDELLIPDANKRAVSGNINLLYSPIKPLTFGGELFYANNEKQDGTNANLTRVLFSMKYAI